MKNNYNNRDPVIRVINLHKSFDNNQVLRGISLDLNKGQNLVVVGRSGTGKSVLIKCLVRLMLPDAGTINVLGNDVLKLSEHELNELRIRIGYLFQEGALYDSMSLEENLLFPLKRNRPGLPEKEMQEMIRTALENVDLSDAREKMPSELSGGMRKRASLARTLILNPEIILYDEPTTGLDPFTSYEISELIVRIQEKYSASSIVVTHDMKCARTVSDQISILHDGIFIASGSFNDLKNHENATIRNYFV
jgi:phospholipid/cholesterol/gamma-HCH transport system ATP-binding protein